ncbi:MAG: coenzyme F420-0:L-glutamate ligase [Hyphomicrobiaceae bacterium]|nr:coenzyme F420-0:L-glutamate ligase [Hyphomicrobiaceae bacterium]
MGKASMTVTALAGIPPVKPGDDLAGLLATALAGCGREPVAGDVLVVAQKIVSKAEGRYRRLADVVPSERARELAAVTGKDARLVELVLGESTDVLRAKTNVMIVAHRLGLVMANAGIDQSNLEADDDGRRVLLLPEDPDASAARLSEALSRRFGQALAVVISDSVGRAWRRGTVGLAIGAAGLPALIDQRGEPDLVGRTLMVTETAFADAVAAAAVLVMGEGREGTPAALVSGLSWTAAAQPARALVRAKAEDLFR